MNRKIWLVVLGIFVVAILIFASYWLYNFFQKESNSEKSSSTESQKLDEEKSATHLSKIENTRGAYWQRMFEIWWEMVESTLGQTSWIETDRIMSLWSID